MNVDRHEGRHADFVRRKLLFEWRMRESRRVIGAYHKGQKSREQAEEELNKKQIPFISR